MLFNSFSFLIFFPLATLFYYVLPHKGQSFWLVIINYIFYMCWSPKYALILFSMTVVTYILGICIEDCHNPAKAKYFHAGGIAFILCFLIFYKYGSFVYKNICRFIPIIPFNLQNPIVSLVAPVGISFYSFQMITYLADLYRQEMKAERNFIRYALFASFFPTLCSGPIERAKHFLPQIKYSHVFHYRQVKNGLLLMVWGFFQKLVISDRIAIFVNEVYGQWQEVPGYLLIIATFLYAFQIYCDFCGYSDIAIGVAQVLGFQVTNNFRQPYFSKSVAEFWRRWHISLSSWFRDYIYIPLGGNRHGKWIQYRNILIVFLISGLWHGASWNFIVWGGYTEFSKL